MKYSAVPNVIFTFDRVSESGVIPTEAEGEAEESLTKPKAKKSNYHIGRQANISHAEGVFHIRRSRIFHIERQSRSIFHLPAKKDASSCSHLFVFPHQLCFKASFTHC